MFLGVISKDECGKIAWYVSCYSGDSFHNIDVTIAIIQKCCMCVPILLFLCNWSSLKPQLSEMSLIIHFLGVFVLLQQGMLLQGGGSFSPDWFDLLFDKGVLRKE